MRLTPRRHRERQYDRRRGALERRPGSSPSRAAAAEDGATIVAFPEQPVGGYPQEDLVQWRALRGRAAGGARAVRARDAPTSARRSSSASRSRAGPTSTTAAALVHAGRVRGLVPKEKLPLYNVFYESRTLARGVARPRRRHASRARRPVRRPRLRPRLRRPSPSRSARTSGRPTARCAAAATRAPRSSATSRPPPSASASPRRVAR